MDGGGGLGGMLLKLIGVGLRLGDPALEIVDVADLQEGLHQAASMLQVNLACDSVEIFHGRRFLAQVDRPAAEA